MTADTKLRVILAGAMLAWLAHIAVVWWGARHEWPELWVV